MEQKIRQNQDLARKNRRKTPAHTKSSEDQIKSVATQKILERVAKGDKEVKAVVLNNDQEFIKMEGFRKDEFYDGMKNSVVKIADQVLSARKHAIAIHIMIQSTMFTPTKTTQPTYNVQYAHWPYPNSAPPQHTHSFAPLTFNLKFTQTHTLTHTKVLLLNTSSAMGAYTSFRTWK